MVIRTSDSKAIESFLKKLYLPPKDSHKGENGKLLIIGGSSLFHAASIWGAEIASHFVDLVHYSSTEENNKVFLAIKKKFRSGIVVSQKDIWDYAEEDDCILVGPGMLRVGEEGEYTRKVTKSLIEKFPQKRFVFDAGALQTMDPSWLLKLKTKPILTPHQKEFEGLFGTKISAKEAAKKYNCIVVLKKVSIIISDGTKEYVIEGGNAGLTKGGTGDVLAGQTAAFYTKNDALTSAVVASYLIKRAADQLFLKRGYWYNIDNLIQVIPEILFSLTLK